MLYVNSFQSFVNPAHFINEMLQATCNWSVQQTEPDLDFRNMAWLLPKPTKLWSLTFKQGSVYGCVLKKDKKSFPKTIAFNTKTVQFFMNWGYPKGLSWIANLRFHVANRHWWHLPNHFPFRRSARDSCGAAYASPVLDLGVPSHDDEQISWQFIWGSQFMTINHEISSHKLGYPISQSTRLFEESSGCLSRARKSKTLKSLVAGICDKFSTSSTKTD